MGYVLGLRCRECGAEYEKQPTHVCELCFGPLEVAYDYDAIKKTVSREKIEAGPRSMWRYADLLPVDGPPSVGKQVGFTPLVKAERLGAELGLNNLYVKNDAVNHPTLSFKDRVVSVALTKAREFGFTTVACASTGNLANSVAAQAAEGGFDCYVFIPSDLEQNKVLGNLIYGAKVVAVDGVYDEVNRLCAEVGDKYGWAFANINLRPFYGDGSKSYGYEIAEQLGWRAPDHVIVPCAGGSLITKIPKAFREFEKLGLLDGPVNTKIYAAQASGCNPITSMVKTGAEVLRPQRPNTIAKSIAIGNPADGYYASDICRKTGGGAEDVTDDELIDGIRLLAQTEGIWTETAGGVTVAVTRKLAEQGRFGRDDVVVIAITGNGLKTPEAVKDRLSVELGIAPTLAAFDAEYELRYRLPNLEKELVPA
uniref:Threonine synthase n=1 Tax=uncultured Armatimonadetes bacterium TaxID=157466 RepID=A0A6J4HRZ0_9BACT|nr:Threonine synthase [uncultured Armatimonadetes bacterium]